MSAGAWGRISGEVRDRNAAHTEAAISALYRKAEAKPLDDESWWKARWLHLENFELLKKDCNPYGRTTLAEPPSTIQIGAERLTAIPAELLDFTCNGVTILRVIRQNGTAAVLVRRSGWRWARAERAYWRVGVQELYSSKRTVLVRTTCSWDPQFTPGPDDLYLLEDLPVEDHLVQVVIERLDLECTDNFG